MWRWFNHAELMYIVLSLSCLKLLLCRLRQSGVFFGRSIWLHKSTRVSLHCGLFVLFFFFAGTEGQVYGSHCLLCRGQRIQPDPGRIHRRILKMLQIKKKSRCNFSFLCLYVFLACNYCRHCGTCVSCMGRLPSPQGNHWLGMTHMYTHTNTHPNTQTETQKIILCHYHVLWLRFLLLLLSDLSDHQEVLHWDSSGRAVQCVCRR